VENGGCFSFLDKVTLTVARAASIYPALFYQENLVTVVKSRWSRAVAMRQRCSLSCLVANSRETIDQLEPAHQPSKLGPYDSKHLKEGESR